MTHKYEMLMNCWELDVQAGTVRRWREWMPIGSMTEDDALWCGALAVIRRKS